MHIGPETRVLELVNQYPFLQAMLTGYAPAFKQLNNPLVRHTVGRMATLKMAASMGGVPLSRLLQDLGAAIEKHTGQSVQVADASELEEQERARKQALKQIILDLHAGVSREEVQRRFASMFEQVSPTEIGRIENELIQEGLPAEEVRRLCNVHVAVFQGALQANRELGQVVEAPVPPGHPVHTMRAENAVIEQIAQGLLAATTKLGDPPASALWPSARESIGAELERLGQVEKHYLRKEYQLFPVLEKKGVQGPPQVMWAVHDQIRAALKAAVSSLSQPPQQAVQAVRAVAQQVVDMVYKENNILLPMSLELLDDADWSEIRKGEDEFGYVMVQPGTEWVPVPGEPRKDKPEARISLDTGLLTAEQVNLVLSHLPVEVSFVDENDEVRYYSGGPDRIFPRSPAVIGRKVQNCHPPKSLETVNRILQSFREGTKDVASFWIQMRGKFLLIQYFAVRDARGNYRGTLEVTQDVTHIRALEGERRLLDWQ